MSIDKFLQGVWYQRKPLWLLILLAPLSALFLTIVFARRAAYQHNLFTSTKMSRPVIVIGNVTVGGTGKTPFVIWLALRLQAKGWRVGIVIRGYGGQSPAWPREVHADTPCSEVGDEAVLLVRRTNAIVIAGPDRVAAALRAIELGAEFVLSDDGLQHYRLARDAEIAVIDAGRLLGNGLLLPAGPLREPRSRLESVDLIVRTRRSLVEDALAQAAVLQPNVETRAGPPTITALAHITDAVSLLDGSKRTLASFRAGPVHAVAGIGNPEAFFTALQAAGLQVDGRALPDHAAAGKADIMFADDAPVLMTEKDAVKCRDIADARHWAVPLDVVLSEADAATVDLLVKRLLHPAHLMP